MNYNPYYNPYQQYPYTGNNQNYQQMQTPNYYQQQPIQQTQPVQTNYLPLTFVNGIEGAKAYIVGARQTIYLKDSDSNLLFEKKADDQGQCTLIAYELKHIDLNNIGKEQPVVKVQNENYLTKEDIKEFITKSDINALETIFETKLDKLSSRIEKLARNGINKGNSSNIKDSDIYDK